MFLDQIAFSSPLLTQPEYNLLLDALKSFQTCPKLCLKAEIYDRLFPEACRIEENYRVFMGCVESWNAAVQSGKVNFTDRKSF